jgi:hypothetical protein
VLARLRGLVRAVFLFLVAVGAVLAATVLAYVLTAEFNCQRCGHPNPEHYQWLIVPRQCRTCGRWCRMWMG